MGFASLSFESLSLSAEEQDGCQTRKANHPLVTTTLLLIELL